MTFQLPLQHCFFAHSSLHTDRMQVFNILLASSPSLLSESYCNIFKLNNTE